MGVDARPVLDRAMSAVGDERVQVLREYLRALVGESLGVDAKAVATGDSVMQLGLDSIKMMDLIARLTADLRFTVYPRELFDQPTIDALAHYLAQQLEQPLSADVPGGRASAEAALAKITAAVTPQRSVTVAPQHRVSNAVLLLSSPRAGSTLLRVMLAGHSRLFCPPELHLLPFSSMRERHERLGQAFLGEGLDRAIMALRGTSPDDAAQEVARMVERDVTAPEVYSLLCGLAGDRMLVDKSPSYALSMGALMRAEEYFDGPRYILLVRHPFAVVESMMRNRMEKLMGADSADPAVFGELVWAQCNDNMLKLRKRVDPERVLLLLYEDLVAEPKTVMERICSFLNIPFEEALLTPYRGARMTDGVRSHSLSVGDPNFLNHKAIEPELGAVWQEQRLQRPLGAYARRVAGELDYSLPGQDRAARTSAAALQEFEEGVL